MHRRYSNIVANILKNTVSADSRSLFTHRTPLHDLALVGVGQLARYGLVHLQEPLHGDVARKLLDALVGDAVFCAAFWTFDLTERRHTGVNSMSNII